VELARMRDHGKTAKELAGLFGYEPTYLVKVAALGFVPGLSKLFGCLQGNQAEPVISNIEARDFLLPLRVWPADVPKNDKALGYSLYDYSEVTAAIDKLLDGSLLPTDLPQYSAERREAIARAQEQAQLEIRFL
jgi:hypothetical protein